MTTAMISALTKRPVDRSVGMTGEITLRGRVLPIGGVREKVLAAHRAGLKTVILPEKNLKDLIDLPKTAKSELKIIPVNHMDEVLQIALSAKAIIEPPRPRKQPKEEGQDDGE
jgi:ATP-dependent Lon protease